MSIQALLYGGDWSVLYGTARSLAPEAFGADNPLISL